MGEATADALAVGLRCSSCLGGLRDVQLITLWGELWQRAGEVLVSNKPVCQDEVDSSIPAPGSWAHMQHWSGGKADD